MMSAANRSDALQRYERVTALPMVVLSLTFIGLLICPIAFTLSKSLDATLATANWIVWSFFAVDYVVRFTLAPQKLKFVRGNLVDLAVVVLPLLAPLRIFSGLRALRLLRAITVLSVAVKTQRETKKIVSPQSVGTALLILGLVVTVAAALEFESERGAAGANITSFGDALWWAVTTVTTVGYGDTYPVTTEGRGVATLLMFVGLGTTSLLAAGLTTFFVGQESQQDTKAILERLEAIERALTERDRNPDTQLNAPPAP